MNLRVGGTSLVQSNVAKSQFKPISSDMINAVKPVESPTKKTSEPPPDFLASLDTDQSFCHVVAAAPHLHEK